MKNEESWIKKADEDLKIAILLLDFNFFGAAAYHSQQAAEKFLKAFLVKNKKPFKKTHNLVELLYLCKDIDKEFQKLEELDLSKLTIYATKARYPEIEIEISEEDAKEAIEIAKKIKEFVLNKLK